MLITGIPLPTVQIPITLPASRNALPGLVALELGVNLTRGGAAHVRALIAPVRAVLVPVTDPQPGDTLPRFQALELFTRTSNRFKAVLRFI